MSVEIGKDGTVQSNDGWAVRFIGPDVIEYCTERAACLVNVGWSATQRSRAIYASESTSPLFPRLREHLAAVAPMLQGHFVVV